MGFWHMFVHPKGLRDLDPEEILHLQSAGPKTRIVDVRTPGEFRRGHIRGALSAPLGSTQDAVREWPRETPILLICQSGHRSQAAAHDLLKLGFRDLAHLKGGMGRWVRHGAPLERG